MASIVLIALHKAPEFLRHSVVDTYQMTVVPRRSPRRGCTSRLHFERRGCLHSCYRQTGATCYSASWGKSRRQWAASFHDVKRPRMTRPRTMPTRIGHQARNASGIRQ